MEGGIYLLEARMHGAAYPLSDARGQMFQLGVRSSMRGVAFLSQVDFNLAHLGA
jgi:hypothetical protein